VNWNAFLVTELGKGVASRVNPHGPIGTVKVVFSDCYTKDDPRYKAIRDGSRAADLETGRGRDLQGKQEVLERIIDVPKEVVTIKYTRAAK